MGKKYGKNTGKPGMGKRETKRQFQWKLPVYISDEIV